MQTNQLRTLPRQSITSSFAAKTERPCSKLRCGRWDLRATKSRQTRGQLCTPRSLFNTPKAKRKRSPQPSVNSSTAENDCPYPMSSSRPNGGQPNNMYDPYSVDDDDVMDLYMVCQLRRDIPTRQPQRNCPYTGTSNAGDRFQHSNETIHRHFVLMMRALGNLAPFVIQPPNMAVTHPKIRNDRRYWPWFKLLDLGRVVMHLVLGLQTYWNQHEHLFLVYQKILHLELQGGPPLVHQAPQDLVLVPL
ncbi:uncharacterized protein LOC114275196 [Camellia sinensis]|uniref:uncharacterized protein LOC114275196 n=1 Tax=Camellia sinensis TaxID=4442 RepID=UPI0010355B83|nr:uncharacterized protein LOC114275196 [Camellia sinensis]